MNKFIERAIKEHSIVTDGFPDNDYVNNLLLIDKNFEMIIDLLIYLDTKLDFSTEHYIDNDIGKSMSIIYLLEEKYPNITNSDSRKNMINNIIDKLN